MPIHAKRVSTRLFTVLYQIQIRPRCSALARVWLCSAASFSMMDRLLHVPARRDLEHPNRSAGHAHRGSHRVSVAVCLAGAVRDWNLVAPSLKRHVVEPLDAHVYAAISNAWSSPAQPRLGRRSRGVGERLGVDAMRRVLGSALRGAMVISDEDLSFGRLAAWAGEAAANASHHHVVWGWIWYLKRWACHELLAESPHGPYEVVLTCRPDLVFFQPFRLVSASLPGCYTLSVGESGKLVTFGEGELVVHDFTLACVNDWLAGINLARSKHAHPRTHGETCTAKLLRSFRSCAMLPLTRMISLYHPAPLIFSPLVLHIPVAAVAAKS